MKKQTKEFLKKQRLIVGLPVEVKFRRNDGSIFKCPAKKGSYILRWEDVLKAFRIDALDERTEP